MERVLTSQISINGVKNTTINVCIAKRCFYIAGLRIIFNSTATVVILNADFIDVHEILLTKTLYIV